MPVACTYPSPLFIRHTNLASCIKLSTIQCNSHFLLPAMLLPILSTELSSPSPHPEKIPMEEQPESLPHVPTPQSHTYLCPLPSLARGSGSNLQVTSLDTLLFSLLPNSLYSLCRCSFHFLPMSFVTPYITTSSCSPSSLRMSCSGSDTC